MSHADDVVRVVGAAGRSRAMPVLPFDLETAPQLVLDFSDANQELVRIDLTDTRAFSTYVFDAMESVGAVVGIGCYDEDRVVYRHSALFEGEVEARSIHMGIDLFVPAGTPIHAPLPGRVHSFAVNDAPGDYGPTIVLEHELEGVRFFTLYGHLSASSVAEISVGAAVAAGAAIAHLGAEHENGGWPPHLHFQVVTEMGEWRGNYPGVGAPSQRARFLELCPDPGPLLGLTPKYSQA